MLKIENLHGFLGYSKLFMILFSTKFPCSVPLVFSFNQPNILNSLYNVEVIVVYMYTSFVHGWVLIPTNRNVFHRFAAACHIHTHDHACVCTTMLFVYLCIRDRDIYIHTFEWRFFFCSIRKSSFVHTGITYCAFNSLRSYTFVRSVCCVLSVANVRAFHLVCFIFHTYFVFKSNQNKKLPNFFSKTNRLQRNKKIITKRIFSLLFKLHTS